MRIALYAMALAVVALPVAAADAVTAPAPPKKAEVCACTARKVALKKLHDARVAEQEEAKKATAAADQ